MLYMHDMERLIGRWNNLSVSGSEIFGEAEFNSKNDFAKQKEQEFNDGFLNGTSLGLKPIKWAMGSDYNLPAETLVLAECELKEISLCTIGANEDTVQLYDNSGNLMDEKTIKDIRLSLSASPQTSQQKPNNKMDFKTLLISTLGLKADAADAEITAALTNLKNENVTLSAAKTAWENAEKERAAQAIQVELTAAVTAGKITEEQKPTWETLLKADFKTAKSGLDAIKPAVAPAQNLAAQVDKASAGAGQGAAAVVELKTISDYYENDKQAELDKMKAEDKPAYIKLCAASGIAESEINWNH